MNLTSAPKYYSTVRKILDGQGKICLTKDILKVKMKLSTDTGSSKEKGMYIFYRFKKTEQ